MSAVLSSSPSLASPLIFGVVFSAPLFGIAIAQAVTYYRSYPADPVSNKIFIGAVMGLDTGHTLSITHSAYFWYIHERLGVQMPLSLLASGFFAYTVVSAVQYAYAIRVWHLSQHNKYLTGVILSASFIQFVSGTGMNTALVVTRTVQSMHSRVSEILGGMQLATSVVCDSLITSSLVYLLRRSRSGFHSTRDILDTLIIYSINIGLITSILSIMTLIIWFSMPQNFIFSTFHIVISKFYVNSLLVSMNARRTIRGASTVDSEGRELHTLSDMVVSSLRSEPLQAEELPSV